MQLLHRRTRVHRDVLLSGGDARAGPLSETAVDQAQRDPRPASLADLLGPVEPALAERLISRRCLAAARQAASRLPAMPIMGFERPLDAGPDLVDVAAACRSGDPAWARLATLTDDHPAAVLRPLLVELGRKSSSAHGSASELWLEIDTGRGATVPSVFFTIARQDLVTALLSRGRELLGLAIPVAAEITVQRWRERLPELEISFLGLLCGRAETAVRICLTVPYGRPAPAFRAATGSPRLDRVVAHARRSFGDITRSMVLSVDLLGAEIGARVGVEIGFGGLTGLVSRSAWYAVWRRLSESGLCGEQLMADHLGWIGITRRHDAAGNWPPVLDAGGPMLAPYELVLQRGISHLKLIYDEQSTPSAAKVYFGFRVGWQPVQATP